MLIITRLKYLLCTKTEKAFFSQKDLLSFLEIIKRLSLWLLLMMIVKINDMNIVCRKMISSREIRTQQWYDVILKTLGKNNGIVFEL